MPVQFKDIQTKRSESTKFHPEDLVFSSFTGRRHGPTEADIDKMVKSLLLPGGQLQEIGVRKDHQGKPVVIFGHTRVKAARRINDLNLTPEPFMVRGNFFSVNEEEAALMTILENDDDTRTPISCVDLAYIIRELETRYGYSNQQVADKLGKQATQMSLYRKLLTLDTKTQEHIVNNRLSLNTALALVNVSPEDRETVLTEAADSGKVTATSVAKAAKTSKAKTTDNFKRTMSDLNKVLKAHKDTFLGQTLIGFLSGDVDEETLASILVRGK